VLRSGFARREAQLAEPAGSMLGAVPAQRCLMKSVQLASLPEWVVAARSARAVSLARSGGFVPAAANFALGEVQLAAPVEANSAQVGVLPAVLLWFEVRARHCLVPSRRFDAQFAPVLVGLWVPPVS
jgi:hypothetical protein